MSADNELESDDYKFANDLYLFLFTKRNKKSFLPHSIKEYSKESPYQDSIGKAVLYTWHNNRDFYQTVLNIIRPENGKSEEECFDRLLACCLSKERKITDKCMSTLIINMSGFLFEAFFYILDNSKHTHFMPLIDAAWIHLFRQYYKDRFFSDGGWEELKKQSAKEALQYELITKRYSSDDLFTKEDIESFFDPGRSDEFRDFILDLPQLIEKFLQFKSELQDLCECRLLTGTESCTKQVQKGDHQSGNTVENSGQCGYRIPSSHRKNQPDVLHVPKCVAAGGPEKIKRYSIIKEQIREIRQNKAPALIPVYLMSDSSAGEIKNLANLFYERLHQLINIHPLHDSSDFVSSEKKNLREQSSEREDLLEAKSQSSDHSLPDISKLSTEDTQEPIAKKES